MMVRHLLLIVAAGLLLRPTQGQESVIKFQGHKDTSAWVVDAGTGRIFASVSSTDEIVEYDSTGHVVRRVQVLSKPSEMIVKGNWLVVASRTPSCIMAINLKTGMAGDVIPLTGQGLHGLFASTAKNSFVYGIFKTADGSPAVVQVDLSNQTVQSQTVYHWGQYDPVHVVMSADGKWVVLDARGAVTPSGADLMRVNEQDFTFEQVRDHHEDFGPISAGPANRYWFLGNQLYPLDLTTCVATFAGNQGAVVHDSFDLVASTTGTVIEFQKFSDATKIRSVRLAEDPQMTSKREVPSWTTSEITLQFDVKNNKLIHASGSSCVIVDFNDILKDLTPQFLIDVPSTVSMNVGDTLELPLRLTRSDLLGDTEFRVKHGPEHAAAHGATLKWSPNDSQIGSNSILIEAVHGDRSHSVNIDVNVESLHIKLDFDIVSMDVDTAGERAIVWGAKTGESGNRQLLIPQQLRSWPQKLAIVDLKRREVLVQKTMKAGLKMAHVDDKYVYVVPASGNTVYRLDRDTLANGKRVFLNFSATSVFRLSAEQIGVLEHTGHSEKVNVYDRSTMKKIAEQSKRFENSLHAKVGENLLLLSNRIVNSKTGDLVCLTSPDGLPQLVASWKVVSGPRPFFANGSSNLTSVFGRRLINNQIVGNSGSPIAEIPIPSKSELSQFAPAVFSLRPELNTTNLDSEIKWYLETRDLVEGAVLDSKIVFAEPRDRSDGSFYDQHSMNHKTMFVLPERVVIATGDKLLVVSISRTTLDNAPMPLHLLWPELPILSIDKPQTLDVKARGGSGEIEYQLTSQYEGIELNNQTGLITVHTPTLWASFLSNLKNSPDIDLLLNRRFSSTTNQFEGDYDSITGKALPKNLFALTLPVGVAVTDEEGQEDQRTFYAIVLAPKNEYMAALVAGKKKRQRQISQEKYLHEQGRRPPTMISDETSSNKRLDQIEKRVRGLEATLDLILNQINEDTRRDNEG